MSESRLLSSAANSNSQPVGYESFNEKLSKTNTAYKATQIYMKLAETTGNKHAANVIKEIADENRVHVGDSIKLLRELADEEESIFGFIAKNVDEKIKDSK
jgi:rubrerythrin